GHSGREGRNEGRDEAPEVSRARGAEGEVPQRSAAQARVRGADARSAKGIPVSLRRREAVRDPDRADREGNACDIRRTRVSGAAIGLIPGDRKVDWYARGVGGAAAREIKGIPAGRPKTQESNIRPAGMTRSKQGEDTDEKAHTRGPGRGPRAARAAPRRDRRDDDPHVDVLEPLWKEPA